MDYIVVTIVGRMPIRDLSHYKASTLSEAVKNQQEWYNAGAIDLVDLLDCCDEHTEVTFAGYKLDR